MAKPEMVTKVTLSSGKVVLLRPMKISHTEVAAQEVAQRANGDSNVLQILMQKVLVRNLLFQIDGKTVTANEKEDMDSLFTIGEYSQLLKVVAKVSGGDDMGKECQTEIVSFGSKSPGSAATHP